MKIVVLDGYTLNPGDLNWEGIKQFGDLEVHDRTPEDQIIARSLDADILLTNKTPLRAAVLEQLPKLKYIGVLATGYNVIDIDYAKTRGIPVSNVSGYGTHSVAQMTFALLLELTLRVQWHSDSARGGDWAASPDFCYWKYPLIGLEGKTMGIIGYGTIGRKVGDIAQAFGMNIIGSARSRKDDPATEHFRWASVPELLRESDVVSIHCPLTPETEGLINKDSLRTMKKSAFLLNTSRGPVIKDQDLADALNEEVIAGAGLDVLSVEPPKADNPLFKAKNCLITPHIAWATFDARARLMSIAEDNLSAFLNGRPQNIVNK